MRNILFSILLYPVFVSYTAKSQSVDSAGNIVGYTKTATTDSSRANVYSMLAAKATLANPLFTGSVSTTGNIGYRTGAGNAVTQATNKSTGVTLNNICGRITMNGAALAAAAEVTFVLTNNTIAATDVIIVNIQSVGTPVSYFISVGAVGNGSCNITLGNVSTGSLSQAVVLNFAVIKSVIN